MLTGAYFETSQNSYGSNAVNMELHLVAQALCRDTKDISYVSDAYSCSFEGHVRTEEIALEKTERELALRETVRELMETPETVLDVVTVYATAGQPALESNAVSVPLTVQALYTTDSGEVCSITRKMSVQSAVELEQGASARVTSLRCSEAYASPTAGGLELRLPVEITALVTGRRDLVAVLGLSLDMEKPLTASGRPSVTVVPMEGNDIWSLAKKYLSTPSLIAEANPDSTEPGSVWIIPRVR
jgi:hypothetical protein